MVLLRRVVFAWAVVALLVIAFTFLMDMRAHRAETVACRECRETRLAEIKKYERDHSEWLGSDAYSAWVRRANRALAEWDSLHPGAQERARIKGGYESVVVAVERMDYAKDRFPLPPAPQPPDTSKTCPCPPPSMSAIFHPHARLYSIVGVMASVLVGTYLALRPART